jgi:hypothetical protein
VYPTLAMILVGVSGFTVVVVRRARSSRDPARENLEGFGYVGATGLLLLAAVVIIIGLFGNRAGTAEGVAMVGFFAYLVYMLVAYVMTRFLSRKPSPFDMAPHGQPGSDRSGGRPGGAGSQQP